MSIVFVGILLLMLIGGYALASTIDDWMSRR